MKKSLIAAVGAAALLAACGGRSDPPAATAEVPASAAESAGGFIGYLKALVASDADTLEPVVVGDLKPPVDDTAEPTPID